MTDCPCPCHGDSEEGASHEDGDCCPALAEADAAFEADMRELAEHDEEIREASMADYLASLPVVPDVPWPVLDVSRFAMPPSRPIHGLVTNVIPIDRARRRRR